MGCEDSSTDSNDGNDLVGIWEHEIINQADGDWMASPNRATYNFTNNEFERNIDYNSYQISYPSNTSHYTETTRGTYSIISDNLFEGTITYEEINGESRNDNVGKHYLLIYVINGDIIELTIETITSATIVFDQISGTPGVLVNSSFHNYEYDEDEAYYFHRKYFFSSDSLYRYYAETQSSAIPGVWSDQYVGKITIVNDNALVMWWDEDDEGSTEVYALEDNKFYLGDDYISFNKQ